MKPIWSGNISFGLINIPVRLYSAAKIRRFPFKLLRKQDLCPIKNIRVCDHTSENVPYGDIVRGYETGKGKYVILTAEDLKRADQKREPVIEVVEFVSRDEIEEEYIERPYYIEPKKEAQKAYVLFREALKKNGKVAVANFIMKTREHLATIRAKDDFLILNQLRYEDEIEKPQNINQPGNVKITDKELGMAVRLMEEMGGKFNPKEFKDKRSEELAKIISQKSKGQLPVLDKKKKPLPKTPQDIMEQLIKSLELARQENTHGK